MNQRGYIGLVLLLLGTGLALYLYMQYSPLGRGATDQGVMKALDQRALDAARAVASTTNKRNDDYEQMLGQ